MRSEQLVEVEGEQRRVVCQTSPIKDVMFMKVDKLLSKCGENCSLCPVFHDCLSNHDMVSSVSARYKLSEAKLSIYLERFRNLTKSEKAEPLFVFFVIGVVICGGCYGVSLPLSWLRHSFFS